MVACQAGVFDSGHGPLQHRVEQILVQIVDFEPPRLLAIKWRNEWSPEFKAEGWSMCTMELEPMDDAVKLTVSHTMERENAKFIGAVGGGWPRILSNLKSLLETGQVVLPAKK